MGDPGVNNKRLDVTGLFSKVETASEVLAPLWRFYQILGIEFLFAKVQINGGHVRFVGQR